MRSEDLLNQPVEASKTAVLEDDNTQLLDSAQAISNFLQAGKTSDAKTVSSPPEPEGRPVSSAEEKSTLDKDLERARAALRLVDMTPQERYKNMLEQAEISLDEARKIVDTVMVQLEPWKETYNITPTVTVQFKTRMPRDIQRLRDVIERMQPRFQATREFESAKYNLAASLVRYGDRTFSHNTEESIAATIEWLSNIPILVFTRLQGLLHEFDTKMSLVFSEGYIENF